MAVKNRIDVISLGCSKNLIDSERLLRRLEAKGYEVHHDSHNVCGEYVVVNTCGFILDAQQESIDMLLELGNLKYDGRIDKIVVMGCLSERFMSELKGSVMEVDFWYGKFDWTSFIDSLPDISAVENAQPKVWERNLTTPEYSAYLKISEGCDRFCAFCAIPLITGRHKSRPFEEIVEEAEDLAARGVKEINVIAQDLSSYGLDLYGEHRLAQLIDRIADIKGIRWIRLHYAYPADFPEDILDVMRRRENVCNYIDIALQHISDKVLSNMRRNISKSETLALLKKMREKVPGIKIRTTLMVGFPGEGEKEFEELLDFVLQARFDRMGAFAYSEEEGTWAQRHLEDSIDDDTKQDRLEDLMDLQEEIALELNEQMIGSEIEVLVQSIDDGVAFCRSEWDSPEVDQEVMVNNPGNARPGDFIKVRITEAFEHDLGGIRIG